MEPVPVRAPPTAAQLGTPVATTRTPTPAVPSAELPSPSAPVPLAETPLPVRDAVVLYRTEPTWYEGGAARTWRRRRAEVLCAGAGLALLTPDALRAWWSGDPKARAKSAIALLLGCFGFTALKKVGIFALCAFGDMHADIVKEYHDAVAAGKGVRDWGWWFGFKSAPKGTLDLVTAAGFRSADTVPIYCSVSDELLASVEMAGRAPLKSDGEIKPEFKAHLRVLAINAIKGKKIDLQVLENTIEHAYGRFSLRQARDWQQVPVGRLSIQSFLAPSELSRALRLANYTGSEPSSATWKNLSFTMVVSLCLLAGSGLWMVNRRSRRVPFRIVWTVFIAHVSGLMSRLLA